MNGLWQHYFLVGLWELSFKSKKSINISSRVQFDTSCQSESLKKHSDIKPNTDGSSFLPYVEMFRHFHTKHFIILLRKVVHRFV